MACDPCLPILHCSGFMCHVDVDIFGWGRSTNGRGRISPMHEDWGDKTNQNDQRFHHPGNYVVLPCKLWLHSHIFSLLLSSLHRFVYTVWHFLKSDFLTIEMQSRMCYYDATWNESDEIWSLDSPVSRLWHSKRGRTTPCQTPRTRSAYTFNIPGKDGFNISFDMSYRNISSAVIRPPQPGSFMLPTRMNWSSYTES